MGDALGGPDTSQRSRNSIPDLVRAMAVEASHNVTRDLCNAVISVSPQDQSLKQSTFTLVACDSTPSICRVLKLYRIKSHHKFSMLVSMLQNSRGNSNYSSVCRKIWKTGTRRLEKTHFYTNPQTGDFAKSSNHQAEGMIPQASKVSLETCRMSYR